LLVWVRKCRTVGAHPCAALTAWVDATGAYHSYVQHIAAAHSITRIDVAVVVALATDDLVLRVTIIGIEHLSTTPTVEDRMARAMLVKPR
jgi:hypothetical protein